MEDLQLPDKWIGMDIMEKWNWLLDKNNGLFINNKLQKGMGRIKPIV